MNRFITLCLLAILTEVPVCAQPSPSFKSRPLYGEMEQALDALSQAALAREQAARTDHDYTAARRQHREVITQLHSLEGRLESQLRQVYQQRPSGRGESQWSVGELESLVRHWKVQQSRAYRSQALCYPKSSLDWEDALLRALEALSTVADQPLNDRSVWEARLQQVKCLRLLGRTSEAQQQIALWQRREPPSSIAAQLVEASQRMLATEPIGKKPPPVPPALSEDPKVLATAAALLHAQGKSDAAVQAYDRLAALHSRAQRVDQQFQARQSAAAIVREMRQHSNALTRFQKLATEYSQHSDAAEQHLIALSLAADLVRSASPEKREAAFQQYVTLLEEHLKHWPHASTAPQVKQWLTQTKRPELQQRRAQMLATQGKRTEAIALYRQLHEIDPDKTKQLEALAELLATGTDETELREALRLWREVEQKSKPGGPRWTRGRRARLTLLEQLGERGQAEKLKQMTKILYGW